MTMAISRMIFRGLRLYMNRGDKEQEEILEVGGNAVLGRVTYRYSVKIGPKMERVSE